MNLSAGDYHPFIRRILGSQSWNRLLIGVAPGSGHTTRTAVATGADVLFAMNAGLYRTAGVSSLGCFLSYGNANDQTDELLRAHILPHSKNVPIVAGVMPLDPTMALAERLSSLGKLGVRGIINFPAYGLVDGTMKKLLEMEGHTHEAEAKMLRVAKKAGFATFGFALNAEQVRGFTESGVDGLIFSVGPTRDIIDPTEKRNQLKYAASKVLEMWRARENCVPSPICFLFGGSVIQPIDLEEIIRVAPLHGYAGGSAFERIPVTNIVESTIVRLKSTPRENRATDSKNLPRQGDLIGNSRPMKHLFHLIETVSKSDVNIWLEGETGTGKELVASYLHANSQRRNFPFVTMNCGAIPESLIESEFFGFEKGAFTGAQQRRRGKFELANHGVLFLDEIGELSAHGQAALLRVIQEGEVLPIGGEKPIPVDVRIVAATNKNLGELLESGTFRSDLYYRICTMRITVPALRDRTSDVPLLVEHFVDRVSALANRRILRVTDEFLQRLMNHSWPGNVRELQHVLTRAALLESSSVLEGKGALPEDEPNMQARKDKPTKRERALKTLEATNNNKSAAARKLCISRKTLYEWLRHDHMRR